jgi:type VI secretion system protein ImpC
MNVSKKELYKNLRLYPGARWDQSPLFKKIYEAEFGQLGGEPYGCLIGDYYFSHLPTDVALRDLGRARRRTRCSCRRRSDADGHGLVTELSNPRRHRQGL